MTTEVRVTGWRYENIRGGIRDVAIEIDPASRWTLIQMPNGTGKTTTMTLMRAVFTGADFTVQEIDELRADDSAAAGAFELELMVDAKPYRVRLDLDFVGRKARYTTTRTQQHGGGSEPGWHLPNALKKLLTVEFTKLFVFDGEFAKEIRTVGKDRTTRSIRTLYRLDRLDELKREIASQVQAEQTRAAAMSRAKEQTGITRLSNDLEKAVGFLDLLKIDLRSHQKERGKLIDRQTAIKVAVDSRTAQDDRFKVKEVKLLKELTDLDTEIASLAADALGAMRSPPKVSPVLLARLHALGTQLTTLKLPKTISTEFFHELAHGTHCVCARTIGEVEKKAIIEGASRYLAEDQITIINRMKRSVRESSDDGTEFAGFADDLRVKRRERRSVDGQLDQLLKEQIESGDDELRGLLEEQARNAVRLNELEEAIEGLTAATARRQDELELDWTDNIPLCRAEVDSRRKKLAVATNTRNFVLAADRVTRLVDAVAEAALGNLRESLCLSTNEKLETLVLGEPLRVERIDSRIELSSQGVASKSGVSEGQSLSVAYAFLTSLLSDAPYRLPFIVDSPAVSLDTQVRREVGEAIPELFDQMIMFVISSERDGFAEGFYERPEARFVTIWRDGANGTRKLDGLDHFRAFHSVDPEQPAATARRA